MRATHGNVMWLACRARDGVQIESVTFIGYEWWRQRHILSGESTTSRSWIRRGWLPHIPLSHFTVFGASQEEMRRAFRDNPLDSIPMTPIHSTISVAICQIGDTIVYAVPAPPSSLGCHSRSTRCFRRTPCVGNIKHPHFSIARSSNHNTIVAMWHELDAEDVLGMACGDGRAQLELARVVGWLISMNVQVLIVTAAC